VAHTTGLDTDTHLAARRLGHIALDELKPAAGPRHLYRPHPCHRRLLIGRTNATPECWSAEAWKNLTEGYSGINRAATGCPQGAAHKMQACGVTCQPLLIAAELDS